MGTLCWCLGTGDEFEVVRGLPAGGRWLSGMSGLSVFLRKTAFKLILISQKCSDTSLCPP